MEEKHLKNVSRNTIWMEGKMKIQFDSKLKYQQEGMNSSVEKCRGIDLMRVIFLDNGVKDAEVEINAIQILKQSGADDVEHV